MASTGLEQYELPSVVSGGSFLTNAQFEEPSILLSLRKTFGRLDPSRLRLAVISGAIVAVYVAVSYAMRLGPGEANDFTVHWYAARALVRGENPYESLHIGSRLILDGRYYYPLTATLIAVPVAWLPIKAAAVMFSGLGAGLLAYWLAREPWRLAALLSAPMLSTAAAGQNTAFVTVAALAPALGWLIAIKPNVGLAILAMRPSKAMVVGAAIFTLASLAVYPSWPREWLHAIATDPGVHKAPAMVPGGIVMLLAFIRWRRPEARLLGVLSLIPHTMTWYDALPLMLIPATLRQLLVLGILSHLASFVAAPMSLTLENEALFAATAPVALWGLYFPALLLVLRRPNEGNLPEWLERQVARWPAWARGVSARPVEGHSALQSPDSAT